MAEKIPTLESLTEDIINDIATAYNIDASEVGDTYRVQAKVDAGKLYPFYLSLSLVQRNVYPDLADPETLARYGVALEDFRPLGNARQEIGWLARETTNWEPSFLEAAQQSPPDVSGCAGHEKSPPLCAPLFRLGGHLVTP